MSLKYMFAYEYSIKCICILFICYVPVKVFKCSEALNINRDVNVTICMHVSIQMSVKLSRVRRAGKIAHHTVLTVTRVSRECTFKAARVLQASKS